MGHKISVCTPTYNRGDLLINLYKSLKNQTFKDFEWIVVDDGSTDCTEENVNKFVEEYSIAIRYISKENSGKHTALNLGIDLAEGELFFIVDSDDMLTSDALEVVWKHWSEIEDKHCYAGVAGLRGYDVNNMIGTTFEGDYIDADAIKYRYELKIRGDKAEVYRTDVLQKNKFPVFEGECFVTEALVWNRIASENLKIRWINKIIYMGNYLEGGLTDNYDRLMINSWKGTSLYYSELLENEKIKLSTRLIRLYTEYLNYCHVKKMKISSIFRPYNNVFYLILGLLLYRLKRIKRYIVK